MWIKELSNCSVHILPAMRDNFIFVIVRGHRALVVDPAESRRVLDFLAEQKLNLDGILVTHKHPDHVGGIADILRSHPEAQVYGPRINADQIPHITQKLDEGDTWTWESLPIMTLKTPGHTKEHISFYFPTEEALFVGDVLFPFGCGRIFDGSLEEQFNSLNRITKLADKTLVFCAHEYALNNLEFTLAQAQELYQPYEIVALEKIKSKIQKMMTLGQITVPFELGQEKQLNPFLRAQDFEIFRDLRLLRNTWQGPTAQLLH